MTSSPTVEPVEKVLSMGHYGMLTLRRIMVARLDAQQRSQLPLSQANITVEWQALNSKVAEVISAEMELAAYIYFVANEMELPDTVAEQVRRLAEKHPEGMSFNMEIPMEMAYEILDATKKAYETNLASIQNIHYNEATKKTTLEYGFPPVQELFQAYAQEWLRRQGDQRSAIG